MSHKCRFCGKFLSIALPSDARMRSFIENLAKRACCNRCADYHRRRRDLVETLQKVALSWSLEKDADGRNDKAEFLRALCIKLVDHAEVHHLLSGLQKDVNDFVENILARPDTASFQAEMMEKNIQQLKGTT